MLHHHVRHTGRHADLRSLYAVDSGGYGILSCSNIHDIVLCNAFRFPRQYELWTGFKKMRAEGYDPDRHCSVFRAFLFVCHSPYPFDFLYRRQHGRLRHRVFHSSGLLRSHHQLVCQKAGDHDQRRLLRIHVRRSHNHVFAGDPN